MISSRSSGWNAVSTYTCQSSTALRSHTHTHAAAVRSNKKVVTKLVSTALCHAGQQQQQQCIQMKVASWSCLSRRQFSNSSSGSSKRDQYTDRDLQLHFDTTTSWPTILIKIVFPPDLHSSVLQFFQLADSSLSGYRSSYTFEDLFQSGVISDQQGVSAVILFRDLQNPLLVKYAFDPNAFIRGAKTAFEVVNLAIASKEFNRHACGVIKQSSDHDLVSEVLSSRLYAACVESSTFLRGQGLEIEMNSVHVSKCVLKSIKTNIISSTTTTTTTTTNDADEKSSSDIATAAATAALTDLSVADQVKSTDGDSTPATTSSSEVDPATMMEKIEMEKIEMEKKKSVASYPPGSVVATVEVMFQSVEEYVHRRQSTVDSTTTTTTAAAGPVEEVFSKRDKTSTWTFQGCISGQTELHWKIVALDGLG